MSGCKKHSRRQTPWAMYGFMVNVGRLLLTFLHGPWL